MNADGGGGIGMCMLDFVEEREEVWVRGVEDEDDMFIGLEVFTAPESTGS